MLSILLGLTLWVTERAIAPEGRFATLVVLVVLVVTGGAAYVGLLRLLSRPASGPAADQGAGPAGPLAAAGAASEASDLDPDLAEDL